MDTVFQYSLNGVYLNSCETPILAAKDIGHKTSSPICGAMNGDNVLLYRTIPDLLLDSFAEDFQLLIPQ